MLLSFKKKNIFISGGTHGIGLACLEKFLNYGGKVITFSRDQNKINFLKKKYKSFKKRLFIYQGDVLDRDFLEKTANDVLKNHKKIDILVHNVGGGGRWGSSKIENNDFKLWDEVYQKNNNGVIIFSKYFLKKMRINKWGRVIAISSINSFETSSDDRPWFTAAKAAQNSIIKNLSKKKRIFILQYYI